MTSFTLNGVTYEYLRPEPTGRLEEIQSWEYGHWPRVEAAVPLVGGGTVAVYAMASRWSHATIHVEWLDGDGHRHNAWVPKGNVRRLTASEWDIIEYQECSETLRGGQVGEEASGVSAGGLVPVSTTSKHRTKKPRIPSWWRGASLMELPLDGRASHGPFKAVPLRACRPADALPLVRRHQAVIPSVLPYLAERGATPRAGMLTVSDFSISHR
ncbi:hypothetical protein [Arthrobacter sp. ISL-72]|uniref:hypothetical protein n=1 Tax=Arthrobacter sp. ISL-72 TaxID=2819114 RepID=UPI001BEBB8F7|nr:hypothetical protein [Arthrobacter sp. ISL-72]MBT2594554.1 hypothetical protein [Arthrobacter sp. ISL-72]